MGITYGGGLIIQEARSKSMSNQDIFFSLTLMDLTHSLIEDTLLMMAIGGHLSGILAERLLFSLGVTYLIVKLLPFSKCITLCCATRLFGSEPANGRAFFKINS